MPIQEYHIEKDVSGIPLNRENMAGKDIWTLPGNCTANRHYPSLPRNTKWFDENVIGSMLYKGDIGDGVGGHYPDLKVSFDRAEIGHRGDNNRLNIYLGHETFKGAIEKQKRSEEDTMKLYQSGIDEFNGDYGALLARCIGVSVFGKTLDKKIILGVRSEDSLQPIFDGLLQGAAGYLPFKKNVREINIENEYHNVLLREMGVERDEINSITPLGVFSFEKDAHGKRMGRDDVDIAAIADLGIVSQEFLNGNRLQKVTDLGYKPGHVRFYALNDMRDVETLVNGEQFDGKVWDVVFSTPIKELIDDDFK